jgi:pimeloyl-ACP methyl ester carboxylesterase
VTAYFSSFDQTRIAFDTSGTGPPVLLVHGFLADAQRNWNATGIVEALVRRGFCVITPDLRGHGRSDAPVDANLYPTDVLARDQEALLEHLGIQPAGCMLVGYSLGARTIVRMLARGAQPPKAVLAGMGESVAYPPGKRAEQFVAGISGQSTDAASVAIAGFFALSGMSREAALAVLASQCVTPPQVLATIETPILCLSGDKDDDNGRPEALAALLGNAKAMRTPGHHLNAPADPAFTAALTAFLMT